MVIVTQPATDLHHLISFINTSVDLGTQRAALGLLHLECGSHDSVVYNHNVLPSPPPLQMYKIKRNIISILLIRVTAITLVNNLSILKV